MKALLESIFGYQRKLPVWLRVVLGLVLVTLLVLYVRAGIHHGQTNNPVIDRNDQLVYLKGAMDMPPSHFQHFVPRMRMPMYMWLLGVAAIFQHPTNVPDADLNSFYPVAQAYSVGLSLVWLFAMFFLLRRWLGNWIGLCFIGVVGAQLYVLRGPYVQPELTLTAFITVTIAWLAYSLHRPSWFNGMICGFLLCGWFLTKASAQIGFGLFGAFLGLKWLLAPRGQKMPYIICGLVTVAAYILPMSPYLWNSYQIFHNPFYNVQGKYYMWATDVDEKHFLQKTSLDRNLDYITDHPERVAELPSSAKYWREHPWQSPALQKNTRDLKTIGIVDRLFHGMDMMFNDAFDEYMGLYFMIGVWICIVLWAMAVYWQDAASRLWEYKWELLFATVLVSLFAFLFGWFVPIKAGPRLINSVALIPLFFATAMTHKLLKDKTLSYGGATLSVERIAATVFLIFWGVFSALQVPAELQLGYFGG